MQEAFRELAQAVAKLTALQTELNVDMRGRRLINCGRAIDLSDYVTKGQLEALAAPPTDQDLVIRTLEVLQRTRIRGDLVLPGLDDAGVMFIRNGKVDADEPNFSWRYTNKSLRIAADGKLRGHHSVEITWPTNPGVDCVLVFSGEDDNATTPIARIAIGQDTASYPAIVPNGVNLELRKAGAAGALVDLTVATLHGNVDGSDVSGDIVVDTVTADEFIASAPATYTETNVTTDRSFDADTVALPELADIVGTLIADLRVLKLVA